MRDRWRRIKRDQTGTRDVTRWARTGNEAGDVAGEKGKYTPAASISKAFPFNGDGNARVTSHSCDFFLFSLFFFLLFSFPPSLSNLLPQTNKTETLTTFNFDIQVLRTCYYIDLGARNYFVIARRESEKSGSKSRTERSSITS